MVMIMMMMMMMMMTMKMSMMAIMMMIMMMVNTTLVYASLDIRGSAQMWLAKQILNKITISNTRLV
eukprot:9255134-Karenia_brevis.AAC.1